jgi:LPXTG-motif cell wall-anchored protein
LQRGCSFFTVSRTGKESSKEWLIVLALIVAVVAGVFWAKKQFRQEIERAKRIRRANKNR